MRKIDIDEVKAFIEAQSPETKIYIGGDSERFNIGNDWYADYTLAVVVHINGNNGCKIFGEVQRERDWDQKKSRPRMRLMNEVYKIAELYQKLPQQMNDTLKACQPLTSVPPDREIIYPTYKTWNESQQK
jgi:predicted RNase H-related nuclease YkuK (DUF458 family)